ncbi:hypothetical protein BBJ28_00015720 [Nothophytophthora sp. Chile5]|nr:hypothetical protein BBJ28_00015720 [Nothophytophthora sp. Chile5]
MWTVAQHQVNEREAALAVGAAGALYATYRLLTAVYRAGAVSRALDAQGLHRPSSTLPVLGNTLDVLFFQTHRLQDWFADESKLSGGKPWVLSILGKAQTLVLTSPSDTEDVFKRQFDVFDKGPDLTELCYDFLGNGIVAVDGEGWRQQRRAASHLFSMHMFRDVMDVVVAEKALQLRDLLAHVAQSEQRVVGLKLLLSKFTSDVFTKIGFGVDLHGLDPRNVHAAEEDAHPFLAAVSTMMETFGARLQSPVFLLKLKRFLGLGDEGKWAKQAPVIQELVQDIMAQALARRVAAEKAGKTTEHVEKDLVSLFAASGEMDANTVRDAALNLFVAGKDTTSFSLSWFIVNMNRYPRVLAKLREEIEKNLPALMTGELDAPSMEDLQKLPYLEAAVRENLRLYMSTVHRAPNRSTTLADGTFVPYGAHVIVPVYAASRVPEIWGPDAEEFRPERWIDEATGKLQTVSPFKSLSFIGGPRQCLGMRFALLEMRVVLAVLLSRFDFETVQDPAEITYDFSMVIPVKGPLQVKVTERGAAAKA